MISFPNAKINLGLQITERLPNGYHSISTCLYPIPVTDALEAIPSKKTVFASSGVNIPGNEKDNLVLRAYKLLKKDYQLPELNIHLLKQIPLGAGLGGGSSDAAFMLKMLNDEFQLFLDDSLLEYYAEQLGSDCPFFIRNKPAIGTGTGTVLEPIEIDLSGFYLQIINPGIHVSTKAAYAGVNPKPAAFNLQETLLSKDFDLWKSDLQNDFEASVFEQHPSLKTLKNTLYESGALYAAMSGSGSTMFGIFDSKPQPIDNSTFSFQETVVL
ncbi:4-(cytidine 5'-diphospho)-2-C-methyl-D-erythritol kinase [Roseivirga misakiensis]|uniref:4-diphosphocytidyl-2-C-methyl-D-erythritol kinase n=2 Tax=Roseivirga misakiensis TaxID=1563681 RepID=A0A1E5T114_9BACT|nr:4-(cytidine 5'-diphospho)-2-C-methyl-D-erythritol kinase [Roseivirga misakiensis]